MKLFIVSDVHGFYDEMQKALSENGFDINNKNHVFVSLGDLLDRGKQPLECLKFVNSIPDDRKILIKGNHEDLMKEMLNRGFPRAHDFHNETMDTVYSILGTNQNDCLTEEAFDCMKNDLDWNKYYNSCIDYWEDSSHIFVHGWIPTFGRMVYGRLYNCEFNKDWRTGNWNDARWFNGMELWNEGIRVPNKTIYCGHWHSSWGHCNLHNDGVEFLEVIETYYMDNDGRVHPYAKHTPFEDKGICAMDACTAATGMVNCKVLTRIKQENIIQKNKG